LDLKAGSISNEKISDTYCEFARADDRLCGQRYRYGYAAANTADWQGSSYGYNGVARFDMESGATQLYEYGPDANAGEPVHIPNPDSEKEEDGYLMSYVYNPGEGSFLAILDAGQVDAGPIARIHIPSRVPNGFHANWMPNLTLG
jgi:carotenoid cleavage dioxygenase-like enzyme